MGMNSGEAEWDDESELINPSDEPLCLSRLPDFSCGAF
jgi:hypothetical protein